MKTITASHARANLYRLLEETAQSRGNAVLVSAEFMPPPPLL